MNAPRHPFHSPQNLIQQIHAQVHLPVRVLVPRPHIRVHKQTQVRVIELHNIRTGFPQQFHLPTQNGHQGFHKRLTRGIGTPRTLRIPHPLP